MRVNIYAEEMTDRVELICKVTPDGEFVVGVRFWLELPATVGSAQVRGPFIHREGDDDTSAVTFWGKRELRRCLIKALRLLDEAPIGQTNGYMAVDVEEDGRNS